MPNNTADNLISTYRDELADNAEKFLDVSRAFGQPDHWTVSIMMSALVGLAANLASQTMDEDDFVAACKRTYEIFVRSKDDTVN